MGRDLKFVARGQEFDYKVHLNLELTEVWGRNPEVLGAKAGDLDLADRSYRGAGEMKLCNKEGECKHYGEIVRSSVTFFESFGKHVFHALIRLENEEFTVDPRRLIQKEKFKNGAHFPAQDTPLSALESEMYLFKSSETFTRSLDKSGQQVWTPKRRLLQAINKFTNCYAGQDQAKYRLSMGMLIDDGFYAVAGNNNKAVRDYVAGMMNDINTMYSSQMGVEIGLDTLVLGDTTGFDKTTFNEAPTRPGSKTCQLGVSARLSQLRSWRQQNHSNNKGLWHLMTHCHPSPGTVGVAYVGALCSSFGVGLSSWVGSDTWGVVAHEFGHNFGAGHTFDKNQKGGIMDYGDGKLNGIYQFHPVHKNEVCTEISNSMTQRRQVRACWSTVSSPTPPPVSTPTPRPTAPTPRPTPPTPRPTVPTPRPTGPTARPTAGTPRPTTGPTVKPIVAGGDLYQWEAQGSYGPCSASCGTGFQTETVTCFKYDLATCSGLNLNAVDTGICTTADFKSSCQRVKVADLFCPRGCKPDANTRACQNLPTCGGAGALCGNGVHDKTEYCDTQLEPCCDSCTGWKTTSACAGTNPNVDAAVTDFEDRLWVFQGPSFSVFDSIDDTTPRAGFPKPLTAIRRLSNTFKQGIDSAASLFDNYVLLFKGLTFNIVDLDEMQQRGGTYNAVTNFGLTQEFINCGKIDAVITSGHFDTMDFICDDVVATFAWFTRSTGASELLTARWPNQNWPASIAPAQTTAAVRERQTGAIRLYKGSYHTTIGAGGNGVTTKNPAVGAQEAVCLVDNCKTCSANLERCNVCKDGFRRKCRGRRCSAPSSFIDMSFDEDEPLGALYEYAFGPETHSADNAGWEVEGTITEDGAFDNGLKLNGNQRFRLQPHDFGGPVRDWKVSFWWKPDTLKKQRFLTLRRNRNGKWIEDFTIDFVDKSKTEPIQANRFALEVNAYNNKFDCYVDNAIQLNEWNKISLAFHNGMFITAANGMKHAVALDTDGDDTAVLFMDWFVGEKNDLGISGTIDKLEVANLEASSRLANGATSGETATWVKVVVGVTAGFFFLVMLFVGYKCYGCSKNKLCAPELEERLSEGMPKDLPVFPQAPSLEESDDVEVHSNPWKQKAGFKPYNHVTGTGGAIQARAPPPKGRKGARAPPPPARGGLDLGLNAMQRKDSWQI